MNEETGQIARPKRRSVQVCAYGDTMAEIEMSALDQAREFFGEGWRLRVDPDYNAYRPSLAASREADAGKKYMADLTVCLVEPEQ